MARDVGYIWGEPEMPEKSLFFSRLLNRSERRKKHNIKWDYIKVMFDSCEYSRMPIIWGNSDGGDLDSQKFK
jgi:hypothetical protein